MLSDSDKECLDGFLRGSKQGNLPPSIRGDRAFPSGTMLGDWRIEGLLGVGGNGEVYRVVNAVTKDVAAAKFLLRNDAASKRRFFDEVGFLAQNKLPQFPRYFGSGSHDGREFLVMELLEPYDVPSDEKGIAAYLLEVCACVRALHLCGIVHRDIKPRNVMRRSGKARSAVLIDFGLIKDAQSTPYPREGVSIVEEKVVGAGTPDYAAPEQMLGCAVSSAADIHALGRIANEAFRGNPPRSWAAIIRRATSSIPEQRYATVEDFAAAIRRRNRLRNAALSCLVAALAAIAAVPFMMRGGNALPRNADAASSSSRSAASGGNGAHLRSAHSRSADFRGENVPANGVSNSVSNSVANVLTNSVANGAGNSVAQFDASEFNRLLGAYFAYRDEHPYDSRTWKTSGELAKGCRDVLKSIADQLEALVARILEDEGLDVGFRMHISRGAGIFPKIPSILVLFDGEKPTNGVYPEFRFLENHAGWYVACVESARHPQGDFAQRFCRTDALDEDVRNRLRDMGFKNVGHTSMPPLIIDRGKDVDEDRLVDGMRRAIGIWRAFRRP